MPESIEILCGSSVPSHTETEAFIEARKAAATERERVEKVRRFAISEQLKKEQLHYQFLPAPNIKYNPLLTASRLDNEWGNRGVDTSLYRGLSTLPKVSISMKQLH